MSQIAQCKKSGGNEIYMAEWTLMYITSAVHLDCFEIGCANVLLVTEMILVILFVYLLLIKLSSLEKTCYGKSEKKNPTYGRHWIYQPMRIVGPIQFWEVIWFFFLFFSVAKKMGGGPIFKALALWADTLYKSKCPCVCTSVCLSVHFWGTV